MPFPLTSRRALALSIVFVLAPGLTVRAGESVRADRQYRFAMALASREDLDRAAAELRRFTELFPDDARLSEATFWLAYTLHKASKSAEAAGLFEKWLATHAQNALADRALFWRAEALASIGKVEEARSAWREVTRRFPKSDRAPNALDSLAWSHFRAGEYAEALRVFRELSGLEERFPGKRLARDARRLSAECLLRLGRAREALSEFDALLKSKSPPGPEAALACEARYGRAQALQALGRAPDAAREFAAVVRLAGKSERSKAIIPEAMLSHASALLGAGNPKEALRVIAGLERRSARGTAGLRACFWKGLALESLGRAKEAASAYAEVLSRPEAHAVHGRAAWQLAELRHGMKDPLGAVVAYDRVIALGGPKELVERSLYNSAVTLGELGRTEDALGRIGRLRRDFREGALAADALYAAGDLLVKLRRFREAVGIYGEFLSRFGGDRRRREVRFRRGWCLSASGSFEGARAEFESLLRANPRGKEAAEAAFLLGEAARKAGRLDEAARAYRMTLDAGPGPERAAEALWALASIAKASEAPEKARAYARRLVGEHPASRLVPWALLLAADAALSGGDAKEALAGYRALLAEYSSHALGPAARSGEAWALMKLARKSEALAAFRRLAGESPGTRFGAEAFYRAAILLREEGRPKEAAGLIEELLRRHPDGRFAEAARLERARALKGRGDVDGAIRELRAFEKRFPKSDLLPEVLRELALAYFGKKDRKAERAAWLGILKEHPGSPAAFDACWGVAALAEEEDDLETAARLYARAAGMKGRAEAAGAAFRRADCLARLGRLKGARAAFAEIPERFPGSAEAASALARAGGIALESKDFRDAEALLRRAEAASPGIATVRLASALRRTRKPAEAVKLLEGHLKLAGLTVDAKRKARLELALALGELGRHAEAESHIRPVIRSKDDELAARAQHALAESFLARGDARAADRAFYELLLLYPYKKWQAEARFRLGRTNERLHDYARAREFYAELVRENPSSPHAKLARERIEALSP